MGRLRMFVVATAAAAVLAAGSAPAAAQEGSFRTVFEDALYGGLTGALVGGAVLVFTDEPQDHLAYVAYGAAAGVLVGALFGVVESAPLAELRDGRLRFACPQPVPLAVADGPGRVALLPGAEVFRARF